MNTVRNDIWIILNLYLLSDYSQSYCDSLFVLQVIVSELLLHVICDNMLSSQQQASSAESRQLFNLQT